MFYKNKTILYVCTLHNLTSTTTTKAVTMSAHLWICPRNSSDGKTWKSQEWAGVRVWIVRSTRQNSLLYLPKTKCETGKKGFNYFRPKKYNALPPIKKFIAVGNLKIVWRKCSPDLRICILLVYRLFYGIIFYMKYCE